MLCFQQGEDPFSEEADQERIDQQEQETVYEKADPEAVSEEIDERRQEEDLKETDQKIESGIDSEKTPEGIFH